jgi:hypothetical protein
LGPVTIEQLVWTDHALLRLAERQLARFEVEDAIREQHQARVPNEGGADWLISATTPDGRSFEAIYDHPVRGDETVATIVSVWRSRNSQ